MSAISLWAWGPRSSKAHRPPRRIWISGSGGSTRTDFAKPPAARADYTAGFGLQPPAFGGDGLDRVDVVLTASGLESFEQEYERAHEYELDGVRVKVLPIERIIVSKRAAKRPKDSAQLPMLEAALAARKAKTEGQDP